MARDNQRHDRTEEYHNPNESLASRIKVHKGSNGNNTSNENSWMMDRRSLMKKGIGSLGLLSLGSGTAAAASEYADYHYEATGEYNNPGYNYYLGTDVRIIESKDTDTGQYRYDISIGTHTSSEWKDPSAHESDHPHYFEGEVIGVDYDTEGDWWFPDNDDHIGGYKYSTADDAYVLKDELNLAVDLAGEFIGTTFSVATAVGEYIYNKWLDEQVDSTTYRTEWDYIEETGAKWRSGVYRKFEVLIDPGTSVSFSFDSDLWTTWGLNLHNEDTIYIMSPSD